MIDSIWRLMVTLSRISRNATPNLSSTTAPDADINAMLVRYGGIEAIVLAMDVLRQLCRGGARAKQLLNELTEAEAKEKESISNKTDELLKKRMATMKEARAAAAAKAVTVGRSQKSIADLNSN